MVTKIQLFQKLYCWNATIILFPKNNFGFFVKRPSTSDNNIKVSALVICATRDASLSLSPYFISDVAIVSFLRYLHTIEHQLRNCQASQNFLFF